jgi:hypothetical protein
MASAKLVSASGSRPSLSDVLRTSPSGTTTKISFEDDFLITFRKDVCRKTNHVAAPEGDMRLVYDVRRYPSASTTLDT